MKRIISVLLSVFLLLQMQLTFAASVPYDWSSLPVGGHGFVTGIVFHPLEKDLLYVRTDVGGAYRWDKDAKGWVQLCDTFDVDEQNFFGIDGIALDPIDPDVVYIAAGANIWAQGDVLKSNDRGKTWERTGLNKPFQGNGSVRSYGENIAVDPNNNSIVYCGTPKDGLWRSEDGALTWEAVSGINSNPDQKHQIRSIVFDSNSGSDGKSQTIYVGTTNMGVQRSTDGGQTWLTVTGTPTNPKRMVVGKSGALYVASTTGLFKLEGDNWTEISEPGNKGKAYNGVALDPNDENIIMAVGYSTNIMKLPIWRSTDGGKTWVNKLSTSKFTSEVPWTKSTSDGSFSSNTADIKIDPFNSKRVVISDWFAPFITDDITAEPNQAWYSPVKGIEEVVPRDGISQPTGKYRFVAGIADIDGMPYEDVTKYPDRMVRVKRQVADEPWMMTTGQIDFCEEDPNIILRVGVDWNVNGKVEYTTDNMETWNNITNIPFYLDAKGNKTTAIPFGRCAVSAKKNPETGNPAFVIIPCYNPSDTKKLPEGMNTAPLVSMDLGKTWEEVKGLPTNLNITFDFWNLFQVIASDRVNGSKFYIFAQNNIYVSEDWGRNWKQTTRLEGDWYKGVIRTAPNLEGEVWAGIGNNGLYRSSDSGKTFNMISSVSSCTFFGFGKEAPGETNPTAFVVGTVNGTYGAYRSIDLGDNWERINDDNFKLGVQITNVTGDRRDFGVVYIGTGGRGFFVGKPKGAELGEQVKETAIPEGTFKIYYNGNLLGFVDKPIIANNTVMVPAREFLKNFSVNMNWDSSSNSLSVNRKELAVQLYSKMAFGDVKETNVKLKLDDNILVANGTEKNLNMAPYLINDTMYVPINDISEAFGAKVKWDEKGQMCNISDDALIMNN